MSSWRVSALDQIVVLELLSMEPVEREQRDSTAARGDGGLHILDGRTARFM